MTDDDIDQAATEMVVEEVLRILRSAARPQSKCQPGTTAEALVLRHCALMLRGVS